MNLSTKISVFQKEMLNFWDSNGRKNLPWRKTKKPWKILVAEVLLRKTTSEQVVPVYLKLQSLSPNDVSKIKQGLLEEILLPLGINKIRADQLKIISQRVANVRYKTYQSEQFLKSLPGVGNYISNAVRCCAFEIPVPALDANMIRIIKRVFAWQSHRSRDREDQSLWKFAGDLVPKQECREFNWAVLDFGALVCTSKNPKCDICPVSSICSYFQSL
jgi:A/G-specific adenine glycosylase